MSEILTEQELQEAIELRIISPSFAERVRQHTNATRQAAMLDSARVICPACADSIELSATMRHTLENGQYIWCQASNIHALISVGL